MNLHTMNLERRIATPFYVLGGNGQHPGGDERNHLVIVERGTPPPPNPNARPGQWDPRTYWSPYGVTPPIDRNTLLCGMAGNRTRARHLRFYRAYAIDPVCDTCVAIAARHGLTPIVTNRAVADDPWTIRGRGLAHEPDPLTGR